MRRALSFFLICILLLSMPFAAFAEDETPGEETPEVEAPKEEYVPVSASDINLLSEVEILAKAVYLVNADTGRVVYEKNAKERISPASTTKIMTSALAMELCDDIKGTVVTLPEDLWDEFSGINISHAGLSGGEELTMEQLLYATMLQSACEGASGIAGYFGGQDFIDKMNAKARSLGCTGTNFTNAHGLYGENHYTTAEDMYKITEWALSVPGFYEIASTARYDIPETNKNEAKTLATTNWMQDQTTRYYTSYVHGVKTGTIDESGRCLVSTAEKNDMTYILVLMGCPFEQTNVIWEDGSSVYNETRAIYDWLFANLTTMNVVNPDTVVTEIPLHYAAKKDSLVVYPEGELSALILKNAGMSPAVRYEIDMPESVEAPIENGQQIGSARVYADDILLGEVKLVSREEVEYSWFTMVMSKMTDILTSKAAYIIYGVVLAVILLYLYYILVLVRRRSAKAKKKNVYKSEESQQNNRRRR